MQRMKLSLACLLCLSWVGAASAQTAIESSSDLGVATLEDYSGGVSYGGAYFDIRTMTGDGVGYRNGFTQIGVLYPVWMTEDMYVAPNARLMVTDNSEVGGNLGGLFRRYSYDRDRIFGAYAYYDFDNSSEGFGYEQFMFGIETLGERIDARMNAYFPTATDQNNFVRGLSLGDDPVFFGNSLGFIGQGLFQSAVAGADFEVGGPLTKRTPWLRGFIGAYAYDADKNDPVGVRARVEAWISNDLSIGVNVTEDSNYGTNVNFIADFRFAGWNPTRYFPQWTTQERMMMPVQRNWRVATANTQKDVLVQGYNPDTGNPYFVVHVDATNAGPGDGTFENPYNNLPSSAPGADLILVQRDGTSLLNPLDGPITLFDNQRLLGEGRAHTADIYASFAGFVFPTQTIVLPGFADDGNYPFLTSAGNIVNLASNNEVSAFNMVNAGGYAIANNPVTGSNGFNLNHLNITGNNGGIFLSNATGTGVLNEINALNNTLGGISIDSGLTPLNLTASNITSNSLPAGTQAFGMRLTSTPGTINANVSNVALNNNVDGLLLGATNGAINLRLRAGAMLGNTNDGLRIDGTNSAIAIDVADTIVNDSGAEGIQANMTGGSLSILGRNITAINNNADNVNLALDNTDMVIDIATALFTGSTTGSGFVLSNTGGSGGGSLSLATVTATGNALDGFRMTGSDFTDIEAFISASVFSNNDRDALSVISNTNAEVDLTATGVFANNSGRHGLNFLAESDSVLTMGVNFAGLNDSGRLDPTGNGVNGVVNDANANLTMVNTSASRAANNGLQLVATNDSNVVMTMSNSNFEENGADGFNIDAQSGSNVTASLITGSLANNASNAIETNVTGVGTEVTVNLQDVNGSNSGEDGILFNVSDSGVLNINALVLNNASNSFDNSGTSGVGDGIDGTINTGGVVTFVFEDTTFANSAENGFLLNITDTNSSFIGSFNRGDFSNSGDAQLGLGQQDAFHINATNNAFARVTLLDTPAANTDATQQRGLYANVTSGADLEFYNTNGDFSSNLLNALNVNVNGTGTLGETTVTLLLDNTPANNSGEDGFIFDVDNAGSMIAQLDTSSLDSSGAAGVIGDDFDGIDGTIDNGSAVTLILNDSAVTNANNDAVQIVADTLSTLNAVFDNSPLDNAGSLNSGNALNLFFRDGAVGTVTLQGGSTATGAGNNAVLVDASGINGTTNTSVTVNALTSDFSDSNQSGLAGLNGNGIRVIAADNANVALNIQNTPITNTDIVNNTPQQRGLLFDVTTGASLEATFLNSDMSNHSLNGVEGTVDGTGLAPSRAEVVLIDSSLDDNLNNGALLTATAGSELVFAVGGITTANSISNNVNFGINAMVNDSTASFVLENTTVNNNGFDSLGVSTNSDGVFIDADNGATIYGRMNGAAITNNSRNGFYLDLLDSTADFGVSGSTITVQGVPLPTGVVNTVMTGNAENGLRILADASTVDFNMIGGSVSANGGTDPTLTNFDNVLVSAVNGSNVEVSFTGTSADNSTRSGFNFVSDNSTFLAQLRAGVSAQNNAYGNGVRFVATGGGVADGQTAMLYMDENGFDATGTAITGTNNFSNNGTQVVTAAGGPDADLPLTGAGVFYSADNIQFAAARISGLADNNGNPNDTTVTNPPNGRDIDGDGDGDHDGIYVSFNTVDTAAFELVGTSSANGNVDGGLDLNITAVNTMAPVTLASDITPPDLTVGATNGAIAIEDFESNSNAGAGISINVTGPTAIDSIYVNNVTANENGGDGLLIDLTDVTGTPDLTITNSQFSYNAGNGVNLLLDNSALGDVLIQGNNTGDAFAGGTLDFEFNNLIWTTFMDNNAGSTFDIASVSIDISPVNQNWRPELTPGSNAFQPFGGSDVTTGLTTVNGTAITAGTNPLEDSSGVVLPDGGVPTGSQVLVLDFSSFNPGEQLQYDLAHTLVGSDSLIGESTLAGSIGIVTLADGRTATGVFTTSGLQITQVFAQTTPGISSNGLDGIHIEQINGSDINSLVIDDNLITNNGTSGTGSGINFAVTTNSDILDLQITDNDISTNATNGVVMTNFTGGQLGTAGTPIEISGNTISGNQNGDGVRIVGIQTTNATPLEFNFEDNTINTNAGNGINLNLVAGAQNLNADFTDNTISGNTAGSGVNIAMAANTTVTNNFDGNTVNSNSGSGINYNLAAGTDVNANFTDNMINGNGSHGINIPLGVGGSFTSNDFYGNTIGTTASRNGGMGVRLVVPDQANFNWNLGDASQGTAGRNLITGNNDAGVGILMTGASTGTFAVENSTFSGTLNGPDANFNGDGFVVVQQGSSSVTGSSILGSAFTGNAGDGARFDVTGNDLGIFAQLNGLTIGDGTEAGRNTFSNNTGDGLEFFRTADGEIIGTVIDTNTFQENTGNGLRIVAANFNTQDSYTIDGSDFIDNGQNGILLDIRADADLLVNMDDNLVFSNNGNGIQLIEQVNTASDSRSLTGVWTRNTVTENGNNGIQLGGVMAGLMIGDPTDTTLGNVVSDNDDSGISVTGAGTVVIGSNTIQGNGNLAELGTAGEDAGVYINSAPYSNVTVTNNLITNNFGDGIQAGISASFSNSSADFFFTDNVIANNDGRGIDLINRGNNSTDATITGNIVTGNDLEAIYIVNTASTTQNQFDASTVNLLANGAVTNDPRLRLLISDNQVIGNGLNSGATSTGLFLRVGTSDASTSYTDDGGFASAGGFTTNALTTASSRGGVIASVFDNTFNGNFGDDILFQSFVSTVDPTNNLTWGNTANPTAGSYQSDPLARLDLYFSNNSSNSTDVSNTIGINSNNQSRVAYYNNSDGTAKSRLTTTSPPNNGPFTSATRRRNAQRQAANPGPTPAGSTFLYPGLGASTFRVQAGAVSGGTDDAFNYFLLNVPFSGGTTTGEQPFIWGTLP